MLTVKYFKRYFMTYYNFTTNQKLNLRDSHVCLKTLPDPDARACQFRMNFTISLYRCSVYETNNSRAS